MKNDQAVRCRCDALRSAARELAREEVEVGAVTRHHRPLAGVIDEHSDGAGEVGVGFDEVVGDALVVEVLDRELTHTIASDLADELGREPAARGPDGNVGTAAPRQQHHLTEGVPALEQLTVGANQDVPGEVAEHAEVGRCRRHTATVPCDRDQFVTVTTIAPAAMPRTVQPIVRNQFDHTSRSCSPASQPSARRPWSGA